MYLLEIEPLDIGEDVRAMGLELTEADENREPIRGAEAAKIWSRVLRAVAGEKAGRSIFSATWSRSGITARGMRLNFAMRANVRW